MTDAETTLEDQRMYARVGNTLRAGLWISTAVMVLGLLLTTVAGKSQAREVLPLDRVGPHIQSADPAVVLDLGILLLFATPLVGVVVALVEFLTNRDRSFAAIAFALLVILAVGFLVALR